MNKRNDCTLRVSSSIKITKLPIILGIENKGLGTTVFTILDITIFKRKFEETLTVLYIWKNHSNSLEINEFRRSPALHV